MQLLTQGTGLVLAALFSLNLYAADPKAPAVPAAAAKTNAQPQAAKRRAVTPKKAASLKIPKANPAPANRGVLDRLEASVNGSLILLSDVVQFRKSMPLRAQLDPLFSDTALAKRGPMAPDTEIVDFLIDERMIVDAFPIKDGEVEQEINSIQSTNRIDRKQLRSALKEQGFAFDEYFNLIRSSVSKRSLIDRDIRTKVYISDDDVKNHFYNQIQKPGTIPFSYRIQILTVTPSNYKTKGAALSVAQDAHRTIKAGEPFTEVAKRVSDDASATTGGDLGMLSEDEIAPQIRSQVKKLKVGEVSDVLGNESSRYFILKLVDIKTGAEDRLAKVKEEIRNQLATSEYQHQIALWLQRQRLNAFVRLAGDTSLPTQNGK
jgi:peptidyl-prolyl cis-trans isomerase SurA